MSDLVRATGERIQWHLDEIEKLFKPGKKLTLLVRNPLKRDGSQDLLMTNDSLADVIYAINIRKNSQ